MDTVSTIRGAPECCRSSSWVFCAAYWAGKKDSKRVRLGGNWSLISDLSSNAEIPSPSKGLQL